MKMLKTTTTMMEYDDEDGDEYECEGGSGHDGNDDQDRHACNDAGSRDEVEDDD